MEWSWLKDWWRLKKPRRTHRRSRTADSGTFGGGEADGPVHDGDMEFSDAHGYDQGGYQDETLYGYDDDDDYICYCDECMNVRCKFWF